MEYQKVTGILRKNVKVGDKVEIVQKCHKESREITVGVVDRIIGNATRHKLGVKVELESGEVGRVQWVLMLV